MDKEKLTEIISKNIAHFRKLSGLTQAQLAERLNYSDKSVSKWERGDGIPDIFVLEEMSEIFGVKVNDFLDEKSLQKRKIKPPLSFGKKVLITVLSSVFVWFVMTTVFVLLNLILSFIGSDYHEQWIVLIYAIPIMAIVDIVLSEVWKWKIASAFFVSLLIWGLAVSIHLSLYIFAVPFRILSLVYLIPAVMQILVGLWYALRITKYKRDT
ncbi:MAG: helix-turn-helix transcriptional regulator [Clostridia bacterium]|nr:helix-turn-helix transcriptional regulator [Clostridia bacterium]